MAKFLVLDSTPLSDLTGDPGTPRTTTARNKLAIATGEAVIVVPEIADYEVRRELIRRGASRGIKRLDDLRNRYVYDPLTTEILRQAAVFWAALRREGRPTADPQALDADVILAAQAVLLCSPGDRVAVVTSNARHLGRIVEIRDWASLA